MIFEISTSLILSSILSFFLILIACLVEFIVDDFSYAFICVVLSLFLSPLSFFFVILLIFLINFALGSYHFFSLGFFDLL